MMHYLHLFDYYIGIVYYVFALLLYLRKAVPSRARRGAGTFIFGTYFSKTRTFTTDGTVPTSGIARRGPPRHVDT